MIYRTVLVFPLLTFGMVLQAQSDYPIHQVPIFSVQVDDDFWSPRLERNRTVTIPASFQECRVTGRLKNFEMAANRQGKFCTTYPFDDTDIYKTIEGASYSLAMHPDKALLLYLDSLIDLISRAQEPDGYLYTARTIDSLHVGAWLGLHRWDKEEEMSHELYCAGHLYEAAVAHYQATGKSNLLSVAIKNADLVCAVFGPEGKKVAPGHEIVEMGLIRLYRVTGNPKYLATAKFFLECRGRTRHYDSTSKDPYKNGSYWQSQLPVTQQREVVGHAVRAMYLYSAMTDVAALTGDTMYTRAVDELWQNMVSKKMYLHGGIGSIGDGERFGENYQLPNATAYAETCASIGCIFWTYRMFLLHGDSKYIDILEKTLYNALLSGIGLDGKSFFYTNAMEVRNDFTHPDLEDERSGWFTCSCCPTNMTRLIPSVPGYVYAFRNRSIYINLFISSSTQVVLEQKDTIRVRQQGHYPWTGNVEIHVNPSNPCAIRMMVRIPGWARGEAIPGNLYRFRDQDSNHATIFVNGHRILFQEENGYAVISRVWSRGDVLTLNLEMPIKKVVANSFLKEDESRLALQRGPIIFCAESGDNYGLSSNLLIPPSTRLAPSYKPAILDGITVLQARVPAVRVGKSGLVVETQLQNFQAIPYFAWANRGKGEMTIWFPSKIKGVDLIANR